LENFKRKLIDALKINSLYVKKIKNYVEHLKIGNS